MSAREAPSGRERQADAFPWPSPKGEAGAKVRWTGHGFDVGGRVEPVLSFGVDTSGWSDGLTALHEGAAGDTHPIDLASRARAIGELRRHGFGKAGSALLEAGSSSGYFLRDARAAFPEALIIGSDYVAGPLREVAARVPSQPLLNFDLTRCPLPDGCLDAFVALNVLEHIRDDEAAAREIARTLRPGGVAIIELPSGQWLYDVHDKALLHERRYSLRAAKRLLRKAGFVIERATHLGFFVFPAFAAIKLRNKRHLARPEAEQREIAARLIADSKTSRPMELVMKLETWAADYVRYPVGVRCFLTARKP